jgi:hypothetical protein
VAEFSFGAEFIVGVVAGASLALLLVIVWPPSRRVREETGMDPEVEARLLLGEDPDEAAKPAKPPADHDRDYDPGELRALRDLGRQGGGKRNKG